MINVYKGINPFLRGSSTALEDIPVTPQLPGLDFQPPSAERSPTRVSQSVINFVIRSRGQREVFTPFINHNPLQRNVFGGFRRSSNLNRDVVIEGPDYNFREINKVIGIDGFASRAMNTLISGTLNGRRGHGFWLESFDPKAKAYIERRLEEITFAINGEGSVAYTMRKIVTSFVTKSNVLLWIKRKNRGQRKQYMWRGQTRNEIIGLEIIDPAMVDVARSPDTEQIIGYQLVTHTYSDVITFADLYHLKWEDMQQDCRFARPLILPVIDDILTLRRLEEIHELAMGKSTFPMYHVKIGDTKNSPQVFGVQSIDTEVHRARDAIEQEAPEGFLVTPGYYSIEVVQPKTVSDFLPYMHYYRDRIIVGLSMDGPSMGVSDTSNRNTAAAMSLQLMEKVRDIRQAIADELHRTIIRELLVEGGFDPIGKSAVHIRWEDPDLESLMAWENHCMALYQGGVITLTETRSRIGLEDLPASDEKDLFHHRTGMLEAKFNPTVNQPTNQHKTSNSKPSRARKRDFDIGLVFSRAFDACKEQPNDTKDIISTHLKTIQDNLYRYVIGESERSEVSKRIGWIEQQIFRQVKRHMSVKDLTKLFDKHSVYIDRLDRYLDSGDQDAKGDGLHQSTAADKEVPADK